MTKYQLNPLETKVFNLIPKGIANAKRVKDIGLVLGMDPREVRGIINSMVNKHVPVCSIRIEPYGIYIPETEEERRIGLVSMVSQVNNMTNRIELVGKIDLKTWQDNLTTTYQTTLDDEVANV